MLQTKFWHNLETHLTFNLFLVFTELLSSFVLAQIIIGTVSDLFFLLRVLFIVAQFLAGTLMVSI